jgi:hypothetical protein
MKYRPMTFPAQSLVPKCGKIYCHVFENPRVDLARNLFWSITIEFESIQYGEDEFDCSMTCEWIVWPIRDWRQLDGIRLDADYGENGVESSFYLVGHDVGTHTKLTLTRRESNLFRVEMGMVVDFKGYYEGDENPAMTVHAEVDVPFIGLLIIPDNLTPKPVSKEEFQAVAAEFVDLSAFGNLEPWKSHGSIFPPTAINEIRASE